MIQEQFHLDPFTSALFLFCGRRSDRIKTLYWEGDGFVPSLSYRNHRMSSPVFCAMMVLPSKR
ncbi:IS66 family insertion sequence element accessory protein TnpB [Proteiniphilum sp. UBA5510]|uniref:IS66 family insertion sequence element accessory protein TnpB n=1 Tax=Proteiniphilum sp. UBA5510 TaxID=1947286 RepID=UPI0039C8D6E3